MRCRCSGNTCKIKSIKTAQLIASNPSIELWFLLHYKNQTASPAHRTASEN
ncbi:MAG: RloB domain-containing protein [Bacteroidales bacterium]|nr:RloB domain-containing protein [Bacteroidales bacterium]